MAATKGFVVGGMEFPEGASELSCNLWMFSQGVRKGDGSDVTPDDRFVFLKRAIDLAFNCEGSIRTVTWNPWTELILREMIGDWRKKRFTGFAGCSSCVDGNTRLLDPITGEQPTIQELCETNTRPWVMTLNGPVLAEVPYIKGESELLEFRLSNGRVFRCTADHWLLAASGWLRARDAIAGDSLHGYVHDPRESISGTCPSNPLQDVRHLSGKAANSQSDYRPSRRLNGESLHSARESAREQLPSRDDAQKRNGYASAHWGVPSDGSERSRLYQESGLSKHSASLQKMLSAIASLFHEVEEKLSHAVPSFQSIEQFRRDSNLLHTCEEPSPHCDCMQTLDYSPALPVGSRSQDDSGFDRLFSQGFQSLPKQERCFQVSQKEEEVVDTDVGFCSFSCDLTVSLVQVESIAKAGIHKFYDLHVPREHHYFAEGAIHHNSGKSDAVALYGLMEYWARPTETFFLVMSTTKLSARMRVWKSITQLWGQAETQGCPGKLIDSDGYIKGINANGKLWRNSGIVLMAAGNSDAEQACKDLLGIKNPNVIIGADEFNELGEGILKTAYENMTSNDRLNFAGMANPDKLTDPFADLCEPEAGWKSINEEQEQWRTKYGTCVRLNAEKSPRIMFPDFVDHNGKHRFHWQPDQEYCDRIAENRGGKKSRGYYRFVKAFWCPDGSTNSIYSEVEFMNSCAMDQDEPVWDCAPIVVSALDPSFSRGGDRSFCCMVKAGQVKGRSHAHVCYEASIEEDMQDKKVPLTHQIVRGWRNLSEEWGVKPHRAIHDNTGAGTPFGHVVDVEWSPAVQKVNFQGKSSGRTVVFRNEDCEYFNKNSELWIQPKEFFRENQISGLSKETMSELVDREYHGKEGRTMRVEGKDEAKKRLKKSPDRADAFLLCIEKLVTMSMLKSEEVKKVAKTANNGWLDLIKKNGMATNSGRKFKR